MWARTLRMALCLEKVWYVVFCLRFLLHGMWIYLHNSIVEAYPHRPTKDLGRRECQSFAPHIAVIGDGTAVGLGDWVVLGRRAGFVGYLEAELNRRPGIKAHWQCFKLALATATTERWLPDSPILYRNGHNLFQYAFHPEHGVFRTAPIVLISLGTFDTCTSERSTQNIRKISDAIVSLHRRREHSSSTPIILVSTIPPLNLLMKKNVAPNDTIVVARGRRNECFRDTFQHSSVWFDRANSEGHSNVGSSTKKSIHLGPDLDSGLAGRLGTYTNFHQTTLSRTGHQRVAKLWADTLENFLIRLEWEWIQTQFN